MTKIDLLRLHRFACVKMAGTSCTSAKDLVHAVLDSVCSAAAGRGGRRWKKSVRFMAHMKMSTRGHAHDERGTADRRLVDRRGDEGFSDLAPAPDVADVVAREEEERRKQAQMKKVWEQAQGDWQVAGILRGLAEDMTASEIRDQLGLTETQYESARRRLRRLLVRLGLRGGK